MRLLIVGALEGQLSQATKLAMDGGAKVAHAGDVSIAMSSLRAGRGADLLLVDVLADIAGLIAALEAERIAVPVVACGTETNAAAAVNAIRAGAKEYIPLPPDAELIAAVIAAVARESSDFVVRDPSMARVIQMARQVAASDASVLITGESGTGKEVMAKFVHAQSRRAPKPFISINCAAIPEALLESELFGHEKGAFTGAVGRRIGKFEEANGGTLLLDEISEMDARLQAKLLRALQERVIDRVGGNRPVPVDIRILATSNRDLSVAVREGQFREDLLFRLNVVNLKLPPLRERPGDIAALSEHFVEKYAKANGMPAKSLSPEAQTALQRAPWPGNVRELENTLHRAVLLASSDTITPEDILLPDGTGLTEAARAPELHEQAAQSAANAARSLVGRTVADVERDLILDTLDHTLGNRTHAANILGISIRTLRNKLNQYAEEGTLVPGPGEQRSVA
ncbi:sigma-54-dependent Fis family transcriptional regulator [Devosia pacifica]|uniref:Sigma-54-dependent Fis family transcriptional regulator n=1 Tax=Devosia pacifica TaxID=1335967 RepID=A0A918VV10_9HYPH|nr:sigma-54 dependent transcriptional regulator [Devosia pacifica]GHA28169.1 sigma-54-dependent Fis family transcriptional regulator [Devosia pacifica]